MWSFIYKVNFAWNHRKQVAGLKAITGAYFLIQTMAPLKCQANCLV